MAKILIIDDDSHLRQMLHLALHIRGHEVFNATNGTDALGVLEADLPDVVILDCQMPGMDGPQTCRVIRSHSQTSIRNVPIVATSTVDYRDEAITAGANYFVQKPFDIEELLKHIIAALSH